MIRCIQSKWRKVIILIETFERPVKVSVAEDKTCMICGKIINEHSKNNLIRCLYESNIRLHDTTLDVRWLNAERRFGKLPKGKPDSIERDDLDNRIFIFDEEKIEIVIDKDGEIVDVRRPFGIEAYSDLPSLRGLKVLIRGKTSDNYGIMEVFEKKVYDKLKITKDDVILDLGGNIGAYSLYAIKNGAKISYCYEADPSNYQMIRKNVNNNSYAEKIQHFNLAVVGNNEKNRDLYLSEVCLGCHSLIPLLEDHTQKISVNAINIQSVINNHNPTAIKMDIEGAEYECLKGISSWGNVKQLILEFHVKMLGEEKLAEIIELLQGKFTNVERFNVNETTLMIYCSMLK